MGSLILCHKRRAERPYTITRIHRRIYTMEELCYYLCNNLYLIDYTIMNETLCKWIDEELKITSLAANLEEILRSHGSIEQFVLAVLEYSKIYSQAELLHIQNVLEKLKNQKDIERQKYKADNLLESGELEPAILVYQSILYGEKDDSVDNKFYGRIYGCLGTAYGRALLYEEAARMYEEAYNICEDPTMLQAYLYACSRYMPAEGYKALLTRSDVFIQADKELQKRCEIVRESIGEPLPTVGLEEWKTRYRRI